MFNKAGTFTCEIDDVAICDPRFSQSPTAFDICIHGKSVEDPDQSDWWRGEMSNDYGKGNFASLTQKEITFKTLRKLGFEGSDLSKLKEQLMGMKIPFTVKESSDGKYFNVKYIGAGGDIQRISDDVAKERLKALMAETPEAPPPTPDPAPQTPPDDEDLPF